MTLLAAVEGPYADRKFKLSGLTKKKYRGALYVDQDGTLTNEERGEAGPVTDDTYMNISLPPLATGVAWDDQCEQTTVQDVVLGFDPADNNLPAQQLEFFPIDFFADPSLLFSGPSSTGFTGISEHRVTGEATTCFFNGDRDLHQFFYGEPQASTIR